MRHCFTLLIVTLAVTSLRAANDPPDASGIESLGNELLQDLAPNAPKQPAPSTNKASKGLPQPVPPNPQPRFNDLGEDVGQPSGSLSLARVRQSMQHAESLLSNNGSNLPTLDEAGKTQQQVVDQLDKLIAELSKQCQNGQCQPSDQQQQQPKQSQRSQNKPGKPKSASAATAGKTAARDSADRLNQASAKPVDKGDVEAMAKELWGHLPERAREQMMQSFSEEFLPQYELEIEQYYRRLSEDDDHLRAD